MKVLYDVTLRRPGCVLLAAAYGADIAASAEFDSEDWLLAPTPDMKVYNVTPDELPKLVKATRAHRSLTPPAAPEEEVAVG